MSIIRNKLRNIYYVLRNVYYLLHAIKKIAEKSTLLHPIKLENASILPHAH